VEVFSQDVEKPYTIIGELKMTFTAELSNEKALNRMKEGAQEVGADALIGFEREVLEPGISRAFDEPTKRKARHQPLEVSRFETGVEKVLLRGLAVRYR
jgi:hypothetical protein